MSISCTSEFVDPGNNITILAGQMGSSVGGARISGLEGSETCPGSIKYPVMVSGFVAIISEVRVHSFSNVCVCIIFFPYRCSGNRLTLKR